MASLSVLTFDAEGRAVDFDVWLDDLQLFLQCDSKDGLSLFDLTSGTSTAPAADADSTVRSQWTTRDAAARLALHATAALSRLMLPYLFPDLAAFSTVADLVAHLHTSDARYRAALPTAFLPTNSPPMYITLYYLVTRLPDSLSSVRDHFLSLCPTELTVDLLEERLAAAEKMGEAALARAREAGVVVGAVEAAVEEVEVVVGVVPGVGASVAAVEAVAAVAEEVEAAAAVVEVAEEVVLVAVQPRSVEALVAASASSSSAPVRTRRFSSFVCGLAHTTQRCFGRLTDAWRAQFPDAVELPRWHDRLLQNVPIFDLDFDAILAAMYALADITKGDCYVSVPPDPGTVAAALGASAAATLGASASAAPGAGTSPLSGTAPTESFHTFTLDSGASRSFFRDSTTLMPLARPVAVSLANPSGGPVLAHSSTVLPCPRLLLPASPLPGPSPYFGPTRGLTKRREPESRPVSPVSRSASPVRTVRTGRVSRPRPPPVPGTHSMTLRPSTAPQRVPLPSPPVSSLPDGPDPESDSLRAASPTVTRFLATAVTDPLFESTAASALVTELVDFAAACCLDYAASLVAESASVCPPSVGGECALGTDVLEDRQEDLECFATASPHLVSMLLAHEGDPDAPDIPTPRSYAEAIEGPYSSQWQAAMDAEMASWKSTGTYVDEVPPPGANIVSGMWIFRVKRPPGSPPAFKARYVARGFSQRQEVDFFQTFSPIPKMTTLRVLLHVATQRDYEVHSLDFSTAFLQGSLHEEIWLRRPPSFTGTTLAVLGFAPSTANPSLFLRTDPTLPPFYVLVYVDDLVFATADTEALAHAKSFSASTSGMGLVLGGRARVVLTGHADDLATQRSSQGYTFSLGSSSVSWRSTRSSSILSSSCEAEIYAGAMAAQELCWHTYLLTDLGEAPRSPPVLYIDNKAMLALCQEHRLEHRTKHIALRYFLARELQQCGQLRLAYVASQANTADVFTKALQPCDHQRFCTVLGLVPTVPHLLSS
ncbi:unnamed protein product [Closterium sp. NIES-53]